MQRRDGVVKVLVTPAVGCGQVAQVAQAVAQVLAVLVVEVLLQGGYLLCAQVVVLHEVVAAQGFCEDGHALGGRPLHLGHLVFVEEDAAGVDDDGIVAAERLHLLSRDAVHVDMVRVVRQHNVGLLRIEGIDHEDSRRGQPAAVGGCPRCHGEQQHQE